MMPCDFLGEPTGKLAVNYAPQRIELLVYECRLHKTTHERQCEICPDRCVGENCKPPEKKQREVKSPQTCRFGGEPTGKMIECPSCKGNVRRKEFACELHGLIVAARCHGCKDFEGKPDARSPETKAANLQ